MRFKWRRHLIVTAFSAASMLPLIGCSSQQQQATDEVAAQGQQGSGDDGGGDGATAQSQSANTGEDKPAGEETAANPAPNGASGGENVVSNSPAAEGTANGDLQEIITEMNGTKDGGKDAQAAAAAPAEGATPEAGTQTAAQAATPAPSPSAQPQAVASSSSLPESGSKMPYVVEAGDTLAKIATKIYGDQKKWRDIASLSGLDNPNHIYPGDLVYYSMDDSSKTFAGTYDSIKRAKETVREGDTLASIAQRVYGNSKFWKHIWRQNDNIENPDKLTAGMSVYYVEKGSVKTAFNQLNKIKTAIKNGIVEHPTKLFNAKSAQKRDTRTSKLNISAV
jgi:nucleoid-associated protein YgaU